MDDKTKAKITRLFYLGYLDFKDGLPMPENRVKAACELNRGEIENV